MTKRAKLNVDQALVIKELHKAGWTQESLARRYGVRQQQVSRIIRGERWSMAITMLQNKRTHKKMLDLIKKCDNIKSATER